MCYLFHAGQVEDNDGTDPGKKDQDRDDMPADQSKGDDVANDDQDKVVYIQLSENGVTAAKLNVATT